MPEEEHFVQEVALNAIRKNDRSYLWFYIPKTIVNMLELKPRMKVKVYINNRGDIIVRR